MRVIQRIPTTQFAYIELEMEVESEVEAFSKHEELLKMYVEGVGLNPSEWKKAKIHMLNTGEFDLNLFESMTKAQRYWVNQTKLALRAIREENETNERSLENSTKASQLPNK